MPVIADFRSEYFPCDASFSICGQSRLVYSLFCAELDFSALSLPQRRQTKVKGSVPRIIAFFPSAHNALHSVCGTPAFNSLAIPAESPSKAPPPRATLACSAPPCDLPKFLPPTDRRREIRIRSHRGHNRMSGWWRRERVRIPPLSRCGWFRW